MVWLCEDVIQSILNQSNGIKSQASVSPHGTNTLDHELTTNGHQKVDPDSLLGPHAVVKYQRLGYQHSRNGNVTVTKKSVVVGGTSVMAAHCG